MLLGWVAVITAQHALQTQLVLLWASKAIAAQLRLAPTLDVAQVQDQALRQRLHRQHHRQASVTCVKLVHVQRASHAFPSRPVPVPLAGLRTQNWGPPACRTARMMVAGRLPALPLRQLLHLRR